MRVFVQFCAMEKKGTSNKVRDNKHIMGSLFWLILTLIPMIIDYQLNQQVNGQMAFASLIIYSGLMFSVFKQK